MSLARALTTRRKEESPAAAPYVGRAASQRAPNAKPIKRSEISLPVALISTTNMLSYEAPDITNAPHVQRMGGRYFSSSASVGSSAPSVSGDESDQNGSVHSRETDATSVDLSSPELPQDPYTNAFFKSSPPALSHRSTVSSRTSASSRPSVELGSPKIPMRAASHSKTAHVLSHKRSIQRMATVASRPSSREPADFYNAQPSANTANHPFGRELEQLNEAAEEFGQAVRVASRSAEAEIDYNVMRAKGLVQYCANDYMDEISSMYPTTFEEDHATYQPMVWI
ncbi:hypothetical protein K461DRAFT_289947 [Myriangium duriaei CBS 260.36]|uniref:Uncharacterized protein n=1 Tax=Myriangium duriaei CBS 260.36 TaxID=1168546 RepID=A0A9P4MPV8_9PEZI|nr:hypothetical protein K461DRAFT_289947 [Myriangium duriaei CBS 260.36]